MHRRGQALALRLLALTGCACPAFADAPSRPVSTSLTIGSGHAVVREVHRMKFSRRDETLVLDWQPGADPSTLLVSGDPRMGVVLLETRWPAPPAPQAPDAVDFTAPRAPADGVAPAVTRVECLLRAVQARPRDVEVLYHAAPFSWQARYELTVRGDIANHLEPLSLDLDGRYFLSNGFGRAFSAAQVQVLGHEAAGPARRGLKDGPGILALEADSPLADRWRPAPPEPGVPHLYRLTSPVTLAAGQVTAVRFATARRTPADRLYVMDSDRIAAGAGAVWRPLQQTLTLRNDRRAGLGFPLPPGAALITAGGGRGAVRQEAMISHTPSGGVIRIDLGPAEGVIGSRRTLGRTSGRTGFTEETIELRIANNLATAVRVEVSERPPVPLAWDMVRSSLNYVITARRLRYELEVGPRSEARISYTVRLTEPEG
ncbi:MAG TPA: hypothetical protein PKE12_15665 [Kiritimatiellia bacterium]|nr:hypothetical protein [Kiritimatiellia bacterium]